MESVDQWARSGVLQQSGAFAVYRQWRVVVEHRLARLVQLGIRQPAQLPAAAGHEPGGIQLPLVQPRSQKALTQMNVQAAARLISDIVGRTGTEIT